MIRVILIAASLSLVSVISHAEEQGAKFNMEIQDGSLSEAAKLVNGFCETEIGKLVFKNPEEKLSLKLEDTTCKQAAKLLKDFDQVKA